MPSPRLSSVDRGHVLFLISWIPNDPLQPTELPASKRTPGWSSRCKKSSTFLLRSHFRSRSSSRGPSHGRSPAARLSCRSHVSLARFLARRAARFATSTCDARRGPATTWRAFAHSSSHALARHGVSFALVPIVTFLAFTTFPTFRPRRPCSLALARLLIAGALQRPVLAFLRARMGTSHTSVISRPGSRRTMMCSPLYTRPDRRSSTQNWLGVIRSLRRIPSGASFLRPLGERS